jgi:hypothetical protein
MLHDATCPAHPQTPFYADTMDGIIARVKAGVWTFSPPEAWADISPDAQRLVRGHEHERKWDLVLLVVTRVSQPVQKLESSRYTSASPDAQPADFA